MFSNAEYWKKDCSQKTATESSFQILFLLLLWKDALLACEQLSPWGLWSSEKAEFAVQAFPIHSLFDPYIYVAFHVLVL
jgi:hypothetical protein